MDFCCIKVKIAESMFIVWPVNVGSFFFLKVVGEEKNGRRAVRLYGGWC